MNQLIIQIWDKRKHLFKLATSFIVYSSEEARNNFLKNAEIYWILPQNITLLF